MWIACPMIVDLRPKKLMNGLKRFCISCFDANASTTGHRFEDVSDACSFGLHHRDTRGQGVMNEHRDLKISVREHLSNMG